MVEIPVFGMQSLAAVLVVTAAVAITGFYACRVSVLKILKHRPEQIILHLAGMASAGLTCIGVFTRGWVDLHDIVVVLFTGAHIWTTWRLWMGAEVPAYMLSPPAVPAKGAQAPAAQVQEPGMMMRNRLGRRATDR